MFLVYDQIVGSGVSLVAILSDVLFVVSPHIPLGIVVGAPALKAASYVIS